MKNNVLKTLLICAASLNAGNALGEQEYYAADTFVNDAFDHATPPANSLWLTGKLGEQAATILGHPPRNLRERYWQRGNRSVWILEEVGKEQPFTVGWVVEDEAITDTKVLVYRETRGWEVRYPAFTRQFNGASLEAGMELDTHIDGISGATLSVRAMQRMGRLALLLHRHVMLANAP